MDTKQIIKLNNKGAAKYELKISDKKGNYSSVYASKKTHFKQYLKNNITMIKETKTNVHFHIDSLNLGNNFRYSHFVEAIKENETAMNDIEKLYHIDISKDLIVTANLKCNYTFKDTFDLSEFMDNF